MVPSQQDKLRPALRFQHNLAVTMKITGTKLSSELILVQSLRTKCFQISYFFIHPLASTTYTPE